MHHHIHSRNEPRCEKCGNKISVAGAECPYCNRSTKTLRRVIGLLAPYKARVLAMMMLTASAAITSLAPPYITKHIIDDVIIGKDETLLPILVFALIFFAAIQWVARISGGILSAWLGAKVTSDLRTKLHDALQHLEMSFFNARNSGEYTGRIMHDTEDVQRFLVDGSSNLIVQVLSMIGIAAVIIVMDWKLAIIVFIPVPILFRVSRKFHKKIHPLFISQAERIASLNTQISETINGIKTIKAFAHEEKRSTVFNDASHDVLDSRVRIEKSFLSFSEGMNWLMTAASATIWLLAAHRIVNGGDLSLGDLTAFVGYIGMFYGPIRWMTHVMNWMIGAMASAERIFTVLDAPRETESNGKDIDPGRLRGNIKLENVHFSYEQGHEVMKDVSLDIKPGEMIGLVGRSGVGKSTLINLICRFYKPDSGNISVDGIPLSDINIRKYRRQIGMVLQEPFLFNASISDNIRCAKPDATHDEVVAAARAANAHNFISARENGYDTVVGEGGSMLSGGEKQRIAIARAILHDPPILILDEATSSVDTETEQLIRSALAKLCVGRTVIAIAHRLSTLRNANRLVVLDAGRVAECGTHDELLAENGIYAGLVHAQTDLNAIHSDTWNP